MGVSKKHQKEEDSVTGWPLIHNLHAKKKLEKKVGKNILTFLKDDFSYTISIQYLNIPVYHSLEDSKYFASKELEEKSLLYFIADEP